MPRILAIMLTVMLGSPAAAWGGALLPNGIEYLGAVPCCGSEDKAEEAGTTPKAERPCCCSAPSRQAPSVDGVYSVIPDEDAQIAPSETLALVRIHLALWPTRDIAESRARAPPPSGSLFAQHTSLLI